MTMAQLKIIGSF